MKHLLLVAVLLFVPYCAYAQYVGSRTAVVDNNGVQVFTPTNPGIITGTTATAPSTVGTTFTSVTCGSTSTSFGVTGTSYLAINIPITATQNVYFAWNGATATVSPPSEGFAPGTTVAWGGGTGSCIVASGTQAVTVVTK